MMPSTSSKAKANMFILLCHGNRLNQGVFTRRFYLMNGEEVSPGKNRKMLEKIEGSICVRFSKHLDRKKGSVSVQKCALCRAHKLFHASLKEL